MEDNENPTPPSPEAPETSAASETVPPIIGAGRRVREAREKAGIPLVKLSADLRISPALMEALEAGQYEKFAGAPYVRATLVSLSRPLRLDPKELLKAYADEIGSQETPSVQVSPYKDDSKTHAKAHKQIFILLLAVLLFILLLIMGKVNTSAPESGPAAPATTSDTLLSINPVPENDSMPLLDSSDTDSLPRLDDTTVSASGSPGSAAKPVQKNQMRVIALGDSVWVRVFQAGKRERSLMVRRNNPMDFGTADTLTFLTLNSGSLRLLLGDTAIVPTHRRFKVVGSRVSY